MVFIPGGEFSRGRNYDWPDTRLAWYPNPLKDDTPVRKVYVNPFAMDEAEVTNEASFTNDLGADSLVTVELIMEFEKEFNISIPDEQAETITTVGQAVAYLEEHAK